MNIWHDIEEERIYPTDFVSVIEIPKGSNMKYELDKKTDIKEIGGPIEAVAVIEKAMGNYKKKFCTACNV